MATPPPPHPGAYLSIEVMPRLAVRGLKAWDIADAAGIARARFSQILRGVVDLTPESALRLGRVLGLDPVYLLHMQADYSLWRCERAIGDEVRALKAVRRVRR